MRLDVLTTINSGFGGLAVGLLLRIDLNPGLEVVELLADLGDGLLLLPTDPGTGGDFWLGLAVVDLVPDVGEDLVFTSIELD